MKCEPEKNPRLLDKKNEHIIPAQEYPVKARNKTEYIVYSKMWTF